MDNSLADECFRCGYNLLGIANDQPCPECGLVAERSRRVTDELHQTRPRWLRRLSWGVWLILLAIVLPLPLSILAGTVIERLLNAYMFSLTSWLLWFTESLPLLMLDIPIAMFSLGVLLLTSREGYSPADHADARLRGALRIALLAPWSAAALLHISVYLIFVNRTNVLGAAADYSWLNLATLATATLGCVPLPILLAIRLRGLARRARSAHLAEHCTIVGIGVAVTLTFGFAAMEIMQNAEAWGWGSRFTTSSNASLLLTAIPSTLSLLFVLWAMYLMIRFAIAFAGAARELRRRWRHGDHAATVEVQ